MRFFIVFVCILVITPIQAGEPYADAENESEAAAMMYTKLIVADEFKLQCEKVSDDLGNLVSDSIRAWNETESSSISAASDIIKKIIESTGKDMTPVISKSTRDGIITLFSQLDGKAGSYCRRFAQSHTSAVQRLRTPKLFKYLDEYSIE